MKHKLLLSTLTAIIVFAAATTAEAGIFGRLSVVWNGCNPCEAVACMPCEPIACNPCDAIACDPCADVCSPCDPCGSFGRPVFRPFGGFFANLGARFSAVNCGPASCDPCEPVACNPCEAIACDPCEPICGPFSGRPVFRPFGGFFANLGARLSATSACCAVSCDPCDPVCDPCASCKW